MSNVVHVSCDATDPFGLREQLFEFFGGQAGHDHSKNPAHHTTGSKLVRRWVVLKLKLDTIHRSIMQTDGVSPDDSSRCSLSSLTASAVLVRSSFPSSAR